MPDQALSDLSVLDLTHHIAGPYCTKLLANYGAEVLKIERPGSGDPARCMGPFLGDIPHPERSGQFLYLNTNKKSITLNLKSVTGRKIFEELVKDADVLVENFSPRVMPGLGLDYATLEKINPRIVMTSISNFGQTGPYRDYKSSEIVNVALGGWLYIVGVPEREPVKPGGVQSQYQAGLQGAVATMTAVQLQQEEGIGQHVDVSIVESVASILESTLWQWSFRQELRKRNGSRYGTSHPLTILPCKDGYVAVTVLGTAWERNAAWMDLPILVEDPRFAVTTDRLKYADDIDALFEPFLMSHGKDELFHTGQALRISFGLVPTAEDIMDDPQHRARNFFVEIEHPETGSLEYAGAPFKMEGTPWQASRAPLLGEHNEEIFCGKLGYSKQDLVRLRETGVI